ncbi:unnamed protein product [Adineta ricciae]|uniref:Large ribosomal subunit protein uL2 C-terminal domain-containing protein n=1 Tax=Adineta ricciae TaxID=249248 RepID=A0A815IN89_ADIRI|nr:unnamed protein product [Adineta ricciae]
MDQVVPGSVGYYPRCRRKELLVAAEGMYTGQFIYCDKNDNYATIVSHNPEGSKTKVKISLDAKKTLSSTNRSMIGIVAGGCRIDKSILTAGRSYHQYEAKQKIMASISRYATPGHKVGLIAVRRIGGTVQVEDG